VTTPRTMKKKMLAERSKTRGKPSDRYPLFVSWSDEDQVFIGYCPVLFVGGVGHDENRIAAYAKLVEIVEEDIQSGLEKGDILAEPKNDIWFAEGAPVRRGRKSLNRWRVYRFSNLEGFAGVLEPAIA
jgi:hypothetical protein